MNDKKWAYIRVRGHLGAEWAEWFDGMTVTQNQDGSSTMAGFGIDQATLYGLLIRIRDLGLELLQVEVTAPQQSISSTEPSTSQPVVIQQTGSHDETTLIRKCRDSEVSTKHT